MSDRILVVDDEEDICAILKKSVVSHRAEVQKIVTFKRRQTAGLNVLA